VEEGVVSLRRQTRGRRIGADAHAEDAGDVVKTRDATGEPDVTQAFGANDVLLDRLLRACRPRALPERRAARRIGGRPQGHARQVQERRDPSMNARRGPGAAARQAPR
jgi:hypothetical protein